MSEADPIPAVPEGEAKGETAEIFADLKGTLGLPFVNLIWRHLATMPGALRTVWDVVRPLYLSSDLEDRGADLRMAAAVPGIEPLPVPLWECAGLDRSGRTEVGRLIDDYNRTNSVNFLALATARLALRGDLPHRPPSRGPTPAAPRPLAFVAQPLPSLAALPSSVLSLVWAIDGLGRLAPSTAIASLYRHLACWPSFLSVAYAALLPHHQTGTLQTAQQTLVVEGRGIAQEDLLPLLPPPVFVLDPEMRGRVLDALQDFTSFMIGRMTVMGLALRALLPQGDR